MKKITKNILMLVAGLAFLGSCNNRTATTTTNTTSSVPKVTTAVTTATTEESTATPKVQLNSVLNLSEEFITASLYGSSTAFKPGTKVIFNVAAGNNLSEGFTREGNQASHVYVYVNGVAYKGDLPKGENQSDYIEVEIEVPTTDFDVVICYSIQQHVVENGHKVTLDTTSSALGTIYGVKDGETYDYLDFYFVANEKNFRVNSMKATIGAETFDFASTVGCKFTQVKGNIYNVTIRPNYEALTGDVVLTVEGEVKSEHAITVTGLDAAAVDLSETSIPTSAVVGDVVDFTLALDNDNYYVASATINGEALNNYGNEYGFYMPDSDVALVFEIKPKIAISVVNTLAHATTVKLLDQNNIYAGNEVTKVYPGQTVYAYVELEQGYALVSGSINGGAAIDAEESENGYAVRFDIPQTENAISISLTESVGYYVTKDDTNIVVSSKAQVAGKTISFSIGAPEGKVTDTVKIKNEEGVDVSALVSLDHADNYGTFVMPAYNVKIEVTYKNLDTTSYHVVANYDDEEFSVYDQSSSWTDLDNGVSVELSGNLNLYIEAYEATEFYYSIKMGNTLVVDKAKVEGDEETGEPAHIFKQIILTGDVQIKVGKTAAEAEIAVAPTSNKVTVTALFDSEEYSISTSSDFDQRFTAPFQVNKGTRYFITVQDDDGLIFYVSFKKASDAKATVYPASEDEDTGEYTFSMAYTFEEDTVIKVGESEASVL